MGELVVIGYVVVTILGVALATIGALGRRRVMTFLGLGMLAAAVSAWIFGPIGLVLGVLVAVALLPTKPKRV